MSGKSHKGSIMLCYLLNIIYLVVTFSADVRDLLLRARARFVRARATIIAKRLRVGVRWPGVKPCFFFFFLFDLIFCFA